MTIILRPHQEKAVQAAIDAGLIGSVDEWIDSAVAKLPKPQDLPAAAVQAKSLIDVFAPIRGMFEDGELDFSRNPSTGRPSDLG